VPEAGMPAGAADLAQMGLEKGTLIGFVDQTAYVLPGVALGPGLASLRLDGAVTGATARR